MAITTAESFLALLERSKLLDRKQLAQAGEALQQAGDAPALATFLVQEKLLTRWQAGQLLAGRSAFFLGKYKLIDLLGSGGMGRVFLAEHTTMSRPVALKIISRQLGQDPASLERFFSEVRAIAGLDHPNIVHAYNLDNEGDRYYMVMEFVEGQDLKRMVEAEGPLDFAHAAGYIEQAAYGLAHAHGRNMIHCDIKPANLLLSEQGVVKILDMGMARLIGRTGQDISEKDQLLLGTVDYMAPEQAIASPDLDHRVDIYSLGCTFYFLLTGRPPFAEGTLHERILKHQTVEPRHIAELRPDAPPDLVEICAKMMAKDPNDRFQSADDVSRVLAGWHPGQQPLKPAVPLGGPESPEGVAGIRVETGTTSAAAGKGGAVSSAPARVREVFSELPRPWLFAGLGGVAALVVLVGSIFLLAGLGEEPDDKDDKDASQVAASNPRPRDQVSTELAPSETEETEEDDDEWPDFPDLGNLTDFDPEAILDPDPGKSGKSGQRQRPDQPAAAKPKPKSQQPDEPEPQKVEPDQPETEESGPDGPETEQAGSENPADQPESTAAPAEERSAEKPQPQKPASQDPLRELAEAVDLPELDTSRASGAEGAGVFTIGKIHSGPEVEWQLYLLGGQTAFKRNRNFVLQQQDESAAQASWLVQLETASASGGPVREEMAKIWRHNNALEFQWAEEAPSWANYLRNCILQVRVEGESKYITLTKPKSVEPIQIDLERGTVNAALPVKWLPGGGNLRVEITKVEGREGHSLKPAEPAEPKAPLELSFLRTDRHGNTADGVAFRLSFTTRPAAMLAKLQLLEPPPTLFRSLKGNVVIERNARENARDELNKKLHPRNRNQAPRGRERSTLNALLDVIEKELWYINFYEEVQGKATIHFRIFTEVDGRQVVLAST